MKHDLMWTYYIRISPHISCDPTTPGFGLYIEPDWKEEIDTEEAAWDEIIRFLPSQGINTVLIDILDGVRFDSHPEIAAPNAWSRDMLKQKLTDIRALGMTPIPKFNFSTAHTSWMRSYRRLTSTPVYYDLCRDLIDETCELFGKPAFFHLGMDEEYPGNEKHLESMIIRNEQLFWHDWYYLFDCCEKNGARPWVWSDYAWKFPDLFVKHMPKSVVQSDWFYFRMYEGSSDPPGWEKAFNAFRTLDELGYDQIPTASTWNNGKCTEQVVAHCKATIDESRLYGFATAAWYHTTMDDIHFLKHDAHRLGMAKNKLYPEKP